MSMINRDGLRIYYWVGFAFFVLVTAAVFFSPARAHAAQPSHDKAQETRASK